MRVGLATGFLAAAFLLPLASKENNAADPPKPDNIPQEILKEEDFENIQTLRTTPPLRDRRLQETKWIEKVYPTIRKGLIDLYRTEKEDNLAIKTGKLSVRDRKVKICFTSYIKPGEEGKDRRIGPSLNVVKMLEKDNRRIYVIEGLPTTEEGNILPAENWRVRVQAFKTIDDLYKPGAHSSFITDSFTGVWNRNDDNSKQGTDTFPFLGRQHHYGKKVEGKSTTENQTESFVPNPTACILCHNISSRNSLTKHLFTGHSEKKINYGALTPDGYFSLSPSRQPGYIEYEDFLSELVTNKTITRESADIMLKTLRYSPNLENQFMVETLEEDKNIPWIEGDTEAIGYDAGRWGFTYPYNNREIEKAIYTFYRPQLSFIGEWWSRRDLAIITGK